MSSDNLNLKVEFSGGLELLFSGQRSHYVSLPSATKNNTSDKPSPSDVGQTEVVRPLDERLAPNLTFLLHWLKDNLLKEREELFMDGDTVRPGILVLVNDTDWELEGEGDYILKDGDEIVLISTLHGG
ncbi:ubiquitin-like modifier 1 [Ramaria rubella]|nr:ubiquitin-like modifier 1 [Ramaria rubella]